MGVDPRRPLVGFAFVAVLCAVLMTLSVGKGWSLDFLQPGKPISSSVGGHVERAPAPSPDAAARVEVGFPVQLSTAPLGTLPGAPAKKQAAAKPATSSSDVAEDDAPDADTSSSTAQVGQEPEATAAPKAEKSAARAERKLARLEAKAQRQQLKAERQVEKAAIKAQSQAAKATEKAFRDAAKAAEKAARDAEKTARKG